MNSQKSSVNKDKASLKDKRDRNKSITIICVLFGSVLGVVLLSLLALGMFSDNNQPNTDSNRTYIFYEADYDYDIMSDKKYLELDRQVYFENPETGVTVVITREKLDDVPNDQKEYISLLCDFIDHAINGNTEELNALFSQEYIDAEGKLKLDFTMQQLYNIKITYIKTISEVVDGNTCESYDYWLEYMIRKNNGTFRNDMESDCVRKEYVRVTKRDGQLGIDVLAPFTTVQNTNDIIETRDVVIITVLAIITIGAFIGTTTLLINNKKKEK